MRHINVVIISVLFSTLIIAGLTACGSGSSGTSSTTAASTNTTSTSWAAMTIAPANKQVTISWVKPAAASTGTTGTTVSSIYNLYWSTSPGVTKSNGNKITNVTSPYSHTGLTNGAMYYYVVTETTAAVEGVLSVEVSAAPQVSVPATPTGFTITAMDSSVQIKADRSTTLKYNIYWSTQADFSNYTKITNATFTTTAPYLHNALTNGTTYYYSISAENLDGESTWTKILSAIPMADIAAVDYKVNVFAPKPAAPNSVSVTSSNQKTTLTWNIPVKSVPVTLNPALPTGVTATISSYNIYYSTTAISADLSNATKSAFPVTATTKPPYSFIHSSLVNNTTYYYVITAVLGTDSKGNLLTNSAGSTVSYEGPSSSQVSAVPVGNAPAAPSGLSATSGTQQVLLNWTKDATANVSYRVYFSDHAPANPPNLADFLKNATMVNTANNSYTHSGLAPGTTYYYIVTSVLDIESLPSTIVAVTM